MPTNTQTSISAQQLLCLKIAQHKTYSTRKCMASMYDIDHCDLMSGQQRELKPSTSSDAIYPYEQKSRTSQVEKGVETVMSSIGC